MYNNKKGCCFRQTFVVSTALLSASLLINNKTIKWHQSTIYYNFEFLI